LDKRKKVHREAHHYLPQDYLRSFAVNQDDQVYFYNKQTRKSGITNVKNLCQETNFHQIIDDEPAVHNLEYIFTGAEQTLMPSLNEVCADFTQQTVMRNWLQLTTLIAFLIARSIRFRKEIKHLVEGAKKVNPYPNITVPDSERDIKRQHFELLHKETQEIADQLRDMKTFLVRNDTPKPFLTSDYPFLIEVPPGEHRFPLDIKSSAGTMLKLPDATLHFPLTPRSMLRISDPGMIGPNDPNFYRLSQPFPTLSVKPEGVDILNERQVYWAYRFLISQTDDFGLVEQTLEQHPELSDIERPRVYVGFDWMPLEQPPEDRQ
jgi:hypothetical protein